MRPTIVTLIALLTKGISGTVHAFTEGPDSSPFYWLFSATPVLDGLAFYCITTDFGGIGTLPSLPGLVQLYEVENSDNGDYLYTTSYAEVRSAFDVGYGVGAVNDLYIFSDQEANTVPLFRFFNGDDHFFTTNYGEGTANGYTSEGVTGYVYLDQQAYSYPIYRWRTDDYSFQYSK